MWATVKRKCLVAAVADGILRIADTVDNQVPSVYDRGQTIDHARKVRQMHWWIYSSIVCWIKRKLSPEYL
jgi:hypothetical protein